MQAFGEPLGADGRRGATRIAHDDIMSSYGVRTALRRRCVVFPFLAASVSAFSYAVNAKGRKPSAAAGRTNSGLTSFHQPTDHNLHYVRVGVVSSIFQDWHAPRRGWVRLGVAEGEDGRGYFTDERSLRQLTARPSVSLPR